MTKQYTYDEIRAHLFKYYAPAFNFEKEDWELLDLAIERGFVFYDIDTETYTINEEY
jgi:hypothetical protein